MKRWLIVAGVCSGSFLYGIHCGENSAVRALCLIANNRDFRIQRLRTTLNGERAGFREAYQSLEDRHTGMASIVDVVVQRMVVSLDGLPVSVVDRLLPLVDSMMRAIETET